MLLWPQWRQYDADLAAVATVEPVAYALGLRAKIDAEQGWHRVLSNVAIVGPEGTNTPVHFDYKDPDSEANILNAAEVTTLVRLPPALGGGYRYWGSRTTSDDEMFAFESGTRTADVLADSTSDALLWAVDKPLHASLMRDIEESLARMGDNLERGGYLQGFAVLASDDDNPPESLSAGKLVLNFDYTPLPPLENLQLNQRITYRHFENFGQ